MSWSKVHLSDVTDRAPEFGFGDNQEVRFPAGDIEAEQTGMNFLTVKPGKREAFAHRHAKAEEVYVVLEGSGRVRLDDELVDLAPFDVLRVGPGVTRKIEAGEGGVRVLVVGPRVQSDAEIVKGFWED